MAAYRSYQLDEARQAGVRDEDIAATLKRHYGAVYDVDGAWKAGVRLEDIVGQIDRRTEAQDLAPAEPDGPSAAESEAHRRAERRRTEDLGAQYHEAQAGFDAANQGRDARFIQTLQGLEARRDAGHGAVWRFLHRGGISGLDVERAMAEQGEGAPAPRSALEAGFAAGSQGLADKSLFRQFAESYAGSQVGRGWRELSNLAVPAGGQEAPGEHPWLDAAQKLARGMTGQGLGDALSAAWNGAERPVQDGEYAGSKEGLRRSRDVLAGETYLEGYRQGVIGRAKKKQEQGLALSDEELAALQNDPDFWRQAVAMKDVLREDPTGFARVLLRDLVANAPIYAQTGGVGEGIGLALNGGRLAQGAGAARRIHAAGSRAIGSATEGALQSGLSVGDVTAMDMASGVAFDAGQAGVRGLAGQKRAPVAAPPAEATPAPEARAPEMPVEQAAPAEPLPPAPEPAPPQGEALFTQAQSDVATQSLLSVTRPFQEFVQAEKDPASRTRLAAEVQAWRASHGPQASFEEFLADRARSLVPEPEPVGLTEQPSSAAARKLLLERDADPEGFEARQKERIDNQIRQDLARQEAVAAQADKAEKEAQRAAEKAAKDAERQAQEAAQAAETAATSTPPKGTEHGEVQPQPGLDEGRNEGQGRGQEAAALADEGREEGAPQEGRQEEVAGSGAEIPAAGRVRSFPTEELFAAPEALQFRQGADSRGVAHGWAKGELPEYNAELSDPLWVWRDGKGELGPAGRVYVVDGHHRLAIARDSARRGIEGAKAIDVRFVAGESAAAVRDFGAWRNVAQGSASDVDIAQLLLDHGMHDPRQLAGRFGKSIPLGRGEISRARALSYLDPDLFAAVRAGRLPSHLAEVLGKRFPDARDQQKIVGRRVLDALAQGREVTLGQVQNLSDLAQSAHAMEGQADLFGGTTFEDDLMDRAAAMEALQRRIRGDKRIYRALGEQANQDAIRAVGSVDAFKAKAQGDAAASRLALFDAVKGRAGAVARLISDIVHEVHNGRSLAKAIDTHYARLQGALEADSGLDFGGQPLGGAAEPAPALRGDRGVVPPDGDEPGADRGTPEGTDAAPGPSLFDATEAPAPAKLEAAQAAPEGRRTVAAVRRHFEARSSREPDLEAARARVGRELESLRARAEKGEKVPAKALRAAFDAAAQHLTGVFEVGADRLAWALAQKAHKNGWKLAPVEEGARVALDEAIWRRLPEAAAISPDFGRAAWAALTGGETVTLENLAALEARVAKSHTPLAQTIPAWALSASLGLATISKLTEEEREPQLEAGLGLYFLALGGVLAFTKFAQKAHAVRLALSEMKRVPAGWRRPQGRAAATKADGLLVYPGDARVGIPSGQDINNAMNRLFVTRQGIFGRLSQEVRQIERATKWGDRELLTDLVEGAPVPAGKEYLAKPAAQLRAYYDGVKAHLHQVGIEVDGGPNYTPRILRWDLVQKLAEDATLFDRNVAHLKKTAGMAEDEAAALLTAMYDGSDEMRAERGIEHSKRFEDLLTQKYGAERATAIRRAVDKRWSEKLSGHAKYSRKIPALLPEMYTRDAIDVAMHYAHGIASSIAQRMILGEKGALVNAFLDHHFDKPDDRADWKAFFDAEILQRRYEQMKEPEMFDDAQRLAAAQYLNTNLNFVTSNLGFGSWSVPAFTSLSAALRGGLRAGAETFRGWKSARRAGAIETYYQQKAYDLHSSRRAIQGVLPTLRRVTGFDKIVFEGLLWRATSQSFLDAWGFHAGRVRARELLRGAKGGLSAGRRKVARQTLEEIYAASEIEDALAAGDFSEEQLNRAGLHFRNLGSGTTRPWLSSPWVNSDAGRIFFQFKGLVLAQAGEAMRYAKRDPLVVARGLVGGIPGGAAVTALLSAQASLYAKVAELIGLGASDEEIDREVLAPNEDLLDRAALALAWLTQAGAFLGADRPLKDLLGRWDGEKLALGGMITGPSVRSFGNGLAALYNSLELGTQAYRMNMSGLETLESMTAPWAQYAGSQLPALRHFAPGLLESESAKFVDEETRRRRREARD